MIWQKAKQQIANNVVVGTGVNTARSSKNGYRVVICVNDDGYIIPYGKYSCAFVTWDMLENCWNKIFDKQLTWNAEELKKLYKNPSPPGCYAEIIRMIFKQAGLV